MPIYIYIMYENVCNPSAEGRLATFMHILYIYITIYIYIVYYRCTSLSSQINHDP